MSSIPEHLKLTYEDYCLLPNDGKRHEIIDGDHFVTLAPNLRHQAVVGKLLRSLGDYLDERPLGWLFPALFDVVLSDTDVVQPDLVFVAKSNAEVLTDDNVRGTPDLLIEILSPSTRKTDLTVKRKLYERFGVPEYWVVDPELETVRIFQLKDGSYGLGEELTAETGDEITSTVLPGLELTVAAVFLA